MKEQYYYPDVLRLDSGYAEIFCPNCFHSLDNPEQCFNCGTKFDLEEIADGTYKANNVNLEKCTHCNGEAILLFDWDTCDYHVECTNCYHDSVEEAIDDWNKRNRKK